MRSSRRQFLAVSPALLTGCGIRRTQIAAVRTPANLAPVDVRRERLIRTTVGLRPFRPAGFVVRAEKLDSKVVIHNYGHGGAGITLCWGTAYLALQEAVKTGLRECAVIGCGVVGLSTACLLQQHGYAVTIYAKSLPPDTTSNLAGGLWQPTSVFDTTAVTPEFRRQFGQAGRFAFRRYELLVGEKYGVRWLPAYLLSDDSARQPPPPESAMSEIESLYPDAKQLAPEENPFAVRFVYRRYSMLIEPSIYLNSLLQDFLIAGGKVVVREFADVREFTSLREDLLFNCTGLGARALFGDNELVPVRGQLSFLLPQPEVAYMTLGPSEIYMFPRRDGILLGGTYERGEWGLDPNPATADRVLNENGKLFAGMHTLSQRRTRG